MIDLLIGVIAWVGFGLIFASFVVYPVTLELLVRIFRKKAVAPAIPTDDNLPTVSLLIACYNEGKVLHAKIKNALSLDYPANKLQILVFSDGSNDNTDEIVKSYAPRVEFLRVDGRKGKTYCQNLSVAQATGEYLVFSDANSMYSVGAIKELIRYAVLKQVGAVVGHRVYVGAGKAGNKEGLYERLENWMKSRESLLGGTIGANGAIYAVRKSAYVELPADRISDINEPLRVAMDHKLEVVFAPHAVAEEVHDNTFMRELVRKRRIVLRAMNSLWDERWNLLKRPDLVFKLVFHKTLRWFTLPLLTISSLAAFTTNCLVLWFAAFSFCTYLLVSLLLFIKAKRTPPEDLKLGKVAGIILYSFGVFYSSMMAFWDFLRGRNRIVWESRG